MVSRRNDTNWCLVGKMRVGEMRQYPVFKTGGGKDLETRPGSYKARFLQGHSEIFIHCILLCIPNRANLRDSKCVKEIVPVCNCYLN